MSVVVTYRAEGPRGPSHTHPMSRREAAHWRYWKAPFTLPGPLLDVFAVIDGVPHAGEPGEGDGTQLVWFAGRPHLEVSA